MSMIEFIKRHEKVLQDSGRDNYRKKLASLRERLEELQSMQPDYQKIADEIYKTLQKENLIPEFDKRIRAGDEVVAVDSFAGKVVRGMKGRVVKINLDHYVVQWEKNIGGSTCGGLTKEGHGWRVYREKIEKVNPLQKPEITTKNGYDEFLAKLKTIVKDETRLEEYLDYEDKQFRRGEQVELLEELGGFNEGQRGFIEVKEDSFYSVAFDGVEINVYSGDMAKVKKKERGIEVGDKVEVVNAPQWYDTQNGSWGYVTKVGKGWTGTKTVTECEIKLEHLINTGGQTYPTTNIDDQYLRVLRDELPSEAKELVAEIEEKFALRGYETKLQEINNEISKLIEEDVIDEDDLHGLLEPYADLEFLDLHDKELEELLNEE